MTALAKRKPDEHQAVQAPNEAAAIFSMIERISANPDIPVERVEQLFGLYQRMEAERARRAYHAAFAEMQPSLPVVERKGKGHNNAKHARLEDITAAIMPVMKEYGFGLSFRVTEAATKVIVKCVVSHRDGHSEVNEYPFPFDTSGAKNAIQAIGSAMTYGKRYTLSSALGIATGDEIEDDGKASNNGELISEAQYKELADLITATKTDLAKFLEVGKVESLSDIQASKFEAAKSMLIAKQRKQSHADN